MREEDAELLQAADLMFCCLGGWVGVVRLKEMGGCPASAVGVPAVGVGVVWIGKEEGMGQLFFSFFFFCPSFFGEEAGNRKLSAYMYKR